MAGAAVMLGDLEGDLLGDVRGDLLAAQSGRRTRRAGGSSRPWSRGGLWAANICNRKLPARLHAMTHAPLDPDNWLSRYGDRLYRYALSRIGDPTKAEDLVQDTLMAAFEARQRFEGKAKESTWLIGILKHKVIDVLRVQGREVATDFDVSSELLDDDSAFDGSGHWQADVKPWADPDAALEQEAFLAALERCIEALPGRSAEAYRLREWHDLDTEEICAALDIATANNLFVILSRARARLRECLDTHWFQREPGGGA